jgi:hypothetical protein
VLDGERVSYIHDPLADMCDPVRDGLCVSRNAGGGFFNADAESVAGRGTPTGTLWKAEACSDDDELFLRWRSLSEGVTPTLINVDLCMVDAVTGIEWDIFIRYWGRNTSSDPGIFEWSRSYGGCVCDTGWTGDDCSVPLLE